MYNYLVHVIFKVVTSLLYGPIKECGTISFVEPTAGTSIEKDSNDTGYLLEMIVNVDYVTMSSIFNGAPS